MELKSTENLRVLMEDRGLSLAALAFYAGCSKGFVSHLTSGRKKSCTTELADKIARCLGVPTSFLFDVKVSPSTGSVVSQQRKAA